MSAIYITDNDVKIGINGGYCTVTHSDSRQDKVSYKTIESIQIFGNAQLTTQCIKTCLTEGIPVIFYSKGGKYFGRLNSDNHNSVERQRLQCKLYQSEFAQKLANKIITTKISNQRIIVNRYQRNRNVDLSEELMQLKNSEKKAQNAESIEVLMGYEGNAAKYYFRSLGKLINPEFAFQGRSKRPPKDPFNSMISMAYSMLFNEIYGKLEARGLNPYYGFIHSDHEKHPTLVSDLMEEWRSIIVDSLVMNIVNHHEVTIDMFTKDMETGGISLSREAIQILARNYNRKMDTSISYLGDGKDVFTYRHALDQQITMLIVAMEKEDVDCYKPAAAR